MSSCPICGSATLHPLLEANGVPVFCNVQWASRDLAHAASRGRLDIRICADCGHAHNAAFDPNAVAYSPAYDNSQHFSDTFRAYARGLVDRLIAAHGLQGKTVVDIGCGRGDLLAMFVQRGGNRGYGFDPSFSPSPDAPLPEDVSVQQRFFAKEEAAQLRPSLVCCRHVLEHVSDPIGFLTDIREALDPLDAPVFYLEVPSGEQLLRDLAVWDYIYEHYSYFSTRSLQLALSVAGFEVLRIAEDFGGQFLCAEVRPRRSAQGAGAAAATTIDVEGAAARFRAKLDGWRGWAEQVSAQARPATVWGAGSKGVMFLNLLGLSAPAPIDFAIDQNPNKTDRYLALSGQVVKAPSFLQESGVDEVVLMNPIYRTEIEDRLSVLGLHPRILVA